MKKIIFFLLVVGFISSCHKEDKKNETPEINYESTGTIEGLDMAMCPCCGNWLLKIDGIETKRPLQFIELPEDADINLQNSTFPLAVKFNWTQDEGACDYIIIDDIALQ